MERIPTIPFIPPEASSVAGPIDTLFLGYSLICAFFGIGIFGAIIYLAVKYRRGSKVDRSNPPLYNTWIEIVWTFGPMVLLFIMFGWATSIYLFTKRPPDNAIQINVVGKQWMWKIQHPEGRWEMNELHIPVGRPVVLNMTSEDVIHDFFVPAFRIHQDVIPGEYDKEWFTPTLEGTYHLFCSQFCGTFHSQMTGEVTVMDPADYQRWLRSGTYTQSLAAQGAVLFREHGCSGCHGAGSSVRAPSLEGLYGRPVPVQIVPPGTPAPQLRAVLAKTPATTIIADDKYIHDCIMLQDQIPAGFEPIMPVFKGQLSEQEVFQLTAYIKSLADSRTVSTGTSAGKYTGTLTRDEYRARTGFVPANIKALTGQAPQNSPTGGAPTSGPNPSSPVNNDIIFGNSSTNQGRTSP